MFAVIQTGGKQYRVAKDDVIRVEKLAGKEGDSIVLDQVLMVNDKIGAPLVSGAKVTAKVVAQARGEKIIVFRSGGVRIPVARTVIGRTSPSCASPTSRPKEF